VVAWSGSIDVKDGAAIAPVGRVRRGVPIGGLRADGRCEARRPAPRDVVLLLPLIHHISTLPAYRYITTASNFFAWSPAIQIVALGVAAAQAAWITRARRRAGWLRVR
jgi:hypothetical protein